MEDNRKKKAVAYWLLAGVFMIMVQVLLGGVTRLTGSGLSITEWKPIMGALPPMSEAEWNIAFEKYKQIAQYKILNNQFGLADFKAIFFWEWFHRLWARSLGVVFAIGFIYFLVKKYFDKQMILPFIILFILGGVQGLIGWIMVASGLNDTSLYVNHIKLAIHFISALGLLCYTLWFALQLLVPKEKLAYNKRLHNFTLITISVLVLQLIYGAFMAGLKAAIAAPTWPSINGSYIPDGIMQQSFINHPINVHLVHRTLAYLLFTLIMFWFGAASKFAKERKASLLSKARWWPFILVIMQVFLGIVTVLSAPEIVFGKVGTFEILAELHQLVAMFLLIALVINIYAVRKRIPTT
ncbi:MAG: heme A synthase [Bacteroidetes bacterium 43-93]|nr:COX15/CtaA family protein [Bacteroidota bacterium]OJW96398.1 MAG: heme A synthase [Bacteroidetes bacterium 43-93]